MNDALDVKMKEADISSESEDIDVKSILGKQLAQIMRKPIRKAQKPKSPFARKQHLQNESCAQCRIESQNETLNSTRAISFFQNRNRPLREFV